MLTDEEKTALTNLRFHANKHVLTEKDLIATMKKEKAPIGDDPNFAVIVGGYRIVMSYEEQKMGLCLHLSISQPEAVIQVFQLPFDGNLKEAVELLGYKEDPKLETLVWSERTPDGRAFNIIQKVEGEKK